ncbi:sensor histidine kinase [Actinacidiphila sp. bgisy160]|uniref:sensor histidine kinase n=1 Tax=Actinacidiphila sp. bgisy160 TaxID=3413796 RepID=UPI003D740D58
MTETSQTSLRTELRMARGALSGLRHDLITDAFAFRPMAPLREGHPLLALVPRRLRGYGRWLPHVALTFFTVFLMFVSLESLGGPGGLVLALLAAVPPLTTMFRPVGAWWLSVGATVLTGVFTGYSWSSTYPWTDTGFVSHLTVLAVVAARTRARVAAEMWLLTAALALTFQPLSGEYGSDPFIMIFLSAVVLSVVSAVRGLRQSRQEVAAQVAVTEVERTRRTLLEERTTIARELHDVVAHHMSVIAIQAEAAPYRVENPPEELTKSFSIIRENAVIALTELRRVLGVVRAEDYQAPDAPQPTLADLDRLVANVREAGLEVEKAVTGAVRELPQGVELSAYRIIQEALSNTLRHAPGAAARVEVSYVLGGLGLRVVNGPARGLVKPSPGAGHGIAGMRERVTMLSGEMTDGPTEDGGYEVTVFIPVPGERA